MTRDQLDAIRARVEAATPGPWEAVTPKRYAAVRSEAERLYVYTLGKIPADTHPDTVARQQRDAQFIAAARQDVPALLAEVERLSKPPKTTWARFAYEFRERAEKAEAEVERLTAEVEMLRGVGCTEDGDGPCGACRKCAFRRGVAAMREAAVAIASKRANLPKHSDLDSAWCRSAECILDELRTLPDPEDTE